MKAVAQENSSQIGRISTSSKRLKDFFFFFFFWGKIIIFNDYHFLSIYVLVKKYLIVNWVKHSDFH